MSSQLKHFIRYQFPAIGWAMIIFIASSVPANYIPTYKIFHHDKIIHATLFFIFGIFVYRALEPFVKKSKFDFGRLFFSISVVILYGVLDEFHQGYVPGRTVDLWDATADTIGGILAAIAIYIVYVRKRSATGNK